MTGTNESIENRSINISLKMLWTVVIGLVMGSLSIAGLYFGFFTKLNEISSDMRENKTQQVGKDQIQDLQLENIKLNVQKLEIELKDFKKQEESKTP